MADTANPPVTVSQPDPLTGRTDCATEFGVAHESALAINPTNPNNLAAAWIQDNGSAIESASSMDGGLTWSNAPVPNLGCAGYPKNFPNGSNTNDESLAFGPDGTLYAAAPVQIAGGTCGVDTDCAIAVNMSADGGRHWSNPAYVGTGQPGIQPATSTLLADPLHPGVAYLAWSDTGGDAWIAVRDASTGIWSPTPVPIYSAAGAFVFPEQLLLLKNGSLAANLVAFDGTSTRLLLATSPAGPDRGTAWLPPTVITVTDNPTDLTLSSAAVAPDGTLYAAWQNPAPAANPPTATYDYSKSTNGGLTWSPPAPIGNNISGPPVIGSITSIRNVKISNLVAPSLAVNEDGTIGVGFYDHRFCNPKHLPTNPCDNPTNSPQVTDMWFRQLKSEPGSAWVETHLAGSFDQTGLTNANDYQAIVPTEHGFAATYALGLPQPGANFKLTNTVSDIFFSRIKVEGG